MDSRHQHDQISDFKIDNSHWGLGHYCMHSGLSVLSHSREQSGESNCRLWTKVQC